MAQFELLLLEERVIHITQQLDFTYCSIEQSRIFQYNTPITGNRSNHMDERKHLISLKGVNKTREIVLIGPNEQGNGYNVTFIGDKRYCYSKASVV